MGILFSIRDKDGVLHTVESGADVTGNNAPQAHGVASHTDVTRELFLPAALNYASIEPPGEYATPLYASKLIDGTTHRIALNFKVPDDFVSFTSIKLVWLATAASGNIYWKMVASYRATGESYITHYEDSNDGATATGGAGIFNVQETANPLALPNLALGDYVSIEARRNGGNAGDTLDVNVYAVGFLFTYVAHQ